MYGYQSSMFLTERDMHTGQCFILMYDVSNREFFHEVLSFVEQIRRVKDEDKVPMVLVG